MLLLKFLLEQFVLANRLARSLAANDKCWRIVGESTANATVEITDEHGAPAITVSLVPCCFKVLRCCQKVRLTIDGAQLKLGVVARIRLKNGLNFYIARRGNELFKHLSENTVALPLKKSGK